MQVVQVPSMLHVRPTHTVRGCLSNRSRRLRQVLSGLEGQQAVATKYCRRVQQGER